MELKYSMPFKPHNGSRITGEGLYGTAFKISGAAVQSISDQVGAGDLSSVRMRMLCSYKAQSESTD